MRSPNFSTFRQAWKGSCSSLPLITMLGKSNSVMVQPTSSGSSMPFLVTMICLGCSSTGRERIRAATSSAVFHLASWTPDLPKRFCPAQTDVWMIFKNS
ncbi:unnamed protein product [Ixodes persulcatus]